MTLYDQYNSGKINILDYCKKALQTLNKAIITTTSLYDCDNDYSNIILERILKTGEITVITRKSGARKSVLDAFNGYDDIIDKDLLSMVISYTLMPTMDFLMLYSSLNEYERTLKIINREEARTIKSFTAAVCDVHEFLDCKSEAGPIRDHNEDFAATVISPYNNNVKFLIVCDGIGGYKKGEQVSELAVKSLISWFNIQEQSLESLDKLEVSLNNEIHRINLEIYTKFEKSGTTLTCAIVLEEETLIANIGDSRLYTMQNSKINQVTDDDSVVYRDYFMTGKASLDDLRFFVKGNVITRALGIAIVCQAKFYRIKNEMYDGLILTSDGVTDILTANDIKRIILESKEEDILNKIIEEAFYGDVLIPSFESCLSLKPITPGKDNATAALYLKK